MKVFIQQVFLIINLIITTAAFAQKSADTVPTGVNPKLFELLNRRTPGEYIIKDIEFIGADHFDLQLLLSITGISVGEKITIPGSDIFSKAIHNIWQQNSFSNVQAYITRLEGNDIYLRFVLTERPRLSDYKFSGAKKSQIEDLDTKVGLVRNRVITENMKRNATEAITKYF
jgi:outer membrane protein insertion porin family